MRHSNLVNKYKKAQRHFEKGNYRRAKWLFEISSSDTDWMGDINLHNSSEDYLNEIGEKDLSINKTYLLLFILVIISTILYFIFRQ